MGYTKAQREAKAKLEVEKVASEKAVETSKPKIKKKLKLDDDTLLSVKSNVIGRLIYINHKNGDETQWEEYGEVQPLSVFDLRAMKAKQPDFFKENWITIVGVESDDEELEEVDLKEICDSLLISQYYERAECPDDLNDIFTWSNDEIREKCPKMTSSVKTSIIVMANEKIKAKELDSIGMVKAIEESLNCILTSPEE